MAEQMHDLSELTEKGGSCVTCGRSLPNLEARMTVCYGKPQEPEVKEPEVEHG
jgi:hypothetical protein